MIYTEVQVGATCDGRCGETVNVMAEFSQDKSVEFSEAEQLVEQCGWMISEEKTYCPTCSKRREDGEDGA